MKMEHKHLNIGLDRDLFIVSLATSALHALHVLRPKETRKALPHFMDKKRGLFHQNNNHNGPEPRAITLALLELCFFILICPYSTV
jgi:hypothetical protein